MKWIRKKWIEFLSIVLIVSSYFLINYCIQESKSKEKERSEKESIDDKSFFIDLELDSNQEKITLISIVENMSKDSVGIIIKEYEMETEGRDSIFEKAIDNISKKYSISKKKAASIVFAYKYNILKEDE